MSSSKQCKRITDLGYYIVEHVKDNVKETAKGPDEVTKTNGDMTISDNDQSRQDKKVDRKERLNEPPQLADRYVIC